MLPVHSLSVSRQASEGDSLRPLKRRDRVMALALFLIGFGVYLASPVTQMHDSRYLTAVSHSLLSDGRFAIAPSIEEHAPGYRVEPHGDRYYHLFPHAPAVLNLPFVGAFQLFGAPVWKDGQFQYDTERRILRVAAAFAAALTVALGLLIGRIFLRSGWSFALAVFFAFGTQLYSTASRAYSSHSWGVALLSIGLYLVLAPRFWRGRGYYVVAASALAWACFCRPTFGLSALALTVPILARERRAWQDLRTSSFGVSPAGRNWCRCSCRRRNLLILVD